MSDHYPSVGRYDRRHQRDSRRPESERGASGRRDRDEESSHRQSRGSRGRQREGRSRHYQEASGGRPHDGEYFQGRRRGHHGDHEQSLEEREYGEYGSGNHGKMNPHHIKYFSWKEINELAKSTPDKVVQAVLSNEAGFFKVFSHSDSCKNPRILKSLITIVYMIVKSSEKQLASRLLGQIYCSDGNCAQFCFQVDRLIKGIPNEQTLLHLIEIGLFGIERVPKTMLDSFPNASLSSTVQAMHRRGDDVHILQKKCEELQKQFEFAQEQMESLTVPNKGENPHDELEPPNDFTTIEVLPQNDDLKCGVKFKPFLRCNITEGRYKNWDHYLDIQFRLLREDFIAPLREGIKSYYESSASRSSEIRVYEHVHVLTPVCLVTGMGFHITFDVTRFKNTIWEHSRRLIFGSLLCLSNNEFRDDSIIFATVVKRDPKLLAEGSLTIKFEGDVNGFHINPTDEYTMVESTAYFEAYRHVLLGLQSASQRQETMPFKRYIVECNMKDLPLPLHVRRTTFDLSMTLGTKSIEARNITISKEATWPHHHTTCLDESQYEALKMALRQEISVIQGPPGTGKTYIGLKLVQAFLHNRTVWDPLKNSPILVVCYTNHALDQFLEDIVDVYTQEKFTPPDIVRVGGRCKNEKLSKFVLAAKVLAVREERSLPGSLHKQSRDARNEMNGLKVAFDTLQQKIDPAEGKLLTLSALQNVIAEDHYLQMLQGVPTQEGKEIEVWLKIWNPSESDAFIEGFLADNEQAPQDSVHEVATNQDESSPEDELIVVDEEAIILQDERMIEGEEIFNEFDKNASVVADKTQMMNRSKRKVMVNEWQTIQISDKERKKKIKRGFQHKPMEERDVRRVKDIHSLDERKRWKLYRYWVNQYLALQKLNLKVSADHYNDVCRIYTEKRQEIDCYVARGADIIGMTTTGAAKHHHILKNIHPKIVIIEEAAEVFESHVITSLSPSVQQLILIGDHKQLRPKPNCYELEKKYDLHVSLFERLIRNGIHFVNLRVQHRMRPDIASLICPAIYDKLHNGKRALEHEKHNIGGIGGNLFFVDHNQHEKRQNPGESFSHVNIHEASFMVSLCRYLLKQGYNQTQITLLTMYRGQLMEMKRRMKRAEFEGVRVAAVDDFQGEENDIILLSLVRSNSDGNIGFLKIENRVCVSMSRARKGFYVIGNFSMLRNREDSVWPKILSVVDKKRCIGDALPLQCQIHPRQKVLARVPEDFSKCPEGGCTQPCNFRLTCGHACTRLCHPWDQDHKLYKCQQQCDKMLLCRHKCNRKCYECISDCGPCIQKVEKTLPICQHSMTLPCSQEPSKVLCDKKCEKFLRCGHLCQARCSEPCDPQCKVKVEKSLPCGHSVEAECYLKLEKILCSVPCNTLLQCEHKCKGTCGLCRQGRLHIHCEAECGRTLVCGHTCTFPCAAECPPCSQSCRNYCTHSKCPKKCYEPCEPCAEPCEWNCRHLKCTKKCGELCNRPPCNEPCLKRLRCGHPCIGLCGEKCPQLCRVCNEENVTEIFFGSEDEPDARFVELQDCNHVFEYSDLDRWMEKQEKEKYSSKSVLGVVLQFVPAYVIATM